MFYDSERLWHVPLSSGKAEEELLLIMNVLHMATRTFYIQYIIIMVRLLNVSSGFISLPFRIVIIV